MLVVAPTEPVRMRSTNMIRIVRVSLLWSVAVLSTVSCGPRWEGADSSCTQIDFDEATLTSLQKCDYTQEFVVKRYDQSVHFDPFRVGTVHYLAHQWQGLTCGETVGTYSFNRDTELRMAYNVIFDSGATLEVRVFDMERLDPDHNPTLVEYWRTTSSSSGWGFFREKLNKTVKQAKIQIEANVNAGSDLAIEYLTIFNYEVDTDECAEIDEFSTTTTTTQGTTIETEGDTTTSTTTTNTEETTTEPEEETTISTTETSQEDSTATSELPTTGNPVETEQHSTTTNAPRDDTSTQGTSPTTTTESSEGLTTSSTPRPPCQEEVIIIASNQWIWMTLTALFGTLFVFAASAAIYLCYVNQHMNRITERLLEKASYPYKA